MKARHFVLLILFCLPMQGYSQEVLGVRLGGLWGGQANKTYLHQFRPVTRSASETTYGPSVERPVGRYFSVEVDALYRRKFEYTLGPSFFGSNSGSHSAMVFVKAHTWEIPVLVELHAPSRLMNAFIGAGLSFRKVSGTYHLVDTITPFFPPRIPFLFESREDLGQERNSWTDGPVIAAGIDIIRVKIFHLRPQARYTRWDASPPELYTKRDAIQLLMGISLGK